MEKQACGWQRAVQAAIDGNEEGRTEATIPGAEVTIFERTSSFCSADDGEGKALFEALRSLRALNRNAPRMRAVETSSEVVSSVITGRCVPSVPATPVTKENKPTRDWAD